MKGKKLQIIPLGGLGEIGKNMTIFEWDKKVLIVDVGLKMPSESVPGVDYIIPDVSYLKKRERDILGVILTHGHYDHIGAIPYLIEKMGNPPIFTGQLTKGIVVKRQLEFPNRAKLDITDVESGSQIQLGPFKIDFFHLNHNITDNLGVVIQTPVGNIVHTSDFKFDETPVNDLPTNFEKLRQIGAQKIDLLMMDSTGAENEGHSLSEKVIMENLDEIFTHSKGRIVAATFASLINRIQQLILLSEKYKRVVAIEGNGMKSNIEICQKLKYISPKKGTIITSKEIENYPDNQVTIISTGAQGEKRAALMRIANGEHKEIRLKKNDTVIFSSSVIPGNERVVQELKDNILRQGARVFHYKMMDIHAGGHAHQEELLRMIRIINPRYLMPIHGQYSMFMTLKQIVTEKLGWSEERIIVADNGSIINLSRDNVFIDKKVIPTEQIIVDGIGVGDVGEVVLKDRRALAEEGMFAIVVVVDKQKKAVKKSPDIISRGFIYLKESKELLYQVRKMTTQIVNKMAINQTEDDWTPVRDELRNKIGQFFYEKTERRPMILPVIILI